MLLFSFSKMAGMQTQAPQSPIKSTSIHHRALLQVSILVGDVPVMASSWVTGAQLICSGLGTHPENPKPCFEIVLTADTS